MVGVRRVPDDAALPLQTLLMPDSLSGGEWSTGDTLEQLPYYTVMHLVMMLKRAAVEVPHNLRRQMDFLQSPHEEETPVCLLDQSRILEGPREVLRDVDTQKLKPGDTFNLCLIDTGGDVHATFGLPEVHNELFGLLGVEGQIGKLIFVVN